ncbi:Steroid 17-alpha-hydroxylase/17,20 lyase [Exaiptasia diaphana]|nr:Steroid 17-alpha-hydroxylase/17,20 lyase [Exaiptasia diaphana]
MNVISVMVYGERYEMNNREFQTILDETWKLNDLLSRVSILDFLPFLIHFPIKDSKLAKTIYLSAKSRLTRKYQEHQQTYQDGITRDLTDALIKALKETKEDQKKTPEVMTEDHILMTMGDAFTAGIESTTSSILWYIILMIRHPDVQAKVHSELDRVVGRDKFPSWEERNSLPYTCASIEEMHRFTGFFFTILINAWAMHFDEKEWNDPQYFKPERFLDTEGKLIQVSKLKSFLPFGTGRRVCVGEAFAKQELFLIITRLMYQFEVEAEIPGSPPSMEGAAVTDVKMVTELSTLAA